MLLGFASPTILVFLGIVALIIFGPKKMPEFGRSMGETLKEFKNATNGIMDEDKDDKEVKK
ncbi:twin-arginine translocase TatA/TatE family subunit [Macrococcus armenti]|uniref:Twin-arginine translocase TatA/TatE family subunit n=1 Tax=Macrococcus armenti TaxID=2875764 RepID=A0ABY3ZTL6_9STAP|nr:twin-arginine translocase TatA/TatE family subunit [Macrococcus armenti]UBH08351.1 twin-arginine translocase TatA/TatE family subunit [Macrococcus armenti]UBH10582.1 twin-arginine translocase TatA/TatE family subunit [Macrococcus armenti]UBH12869.1 twin-arginine translocase TatA/TatE family subunit [Macrococcus armenti]UBH15119.1 twin-arginine translocase TatA/TatE family subunit [Macrococcus armenti]UBH17480.1 twin-arginine translocase TatA/TatE family subunit [Macrococcus armenti]